MTEEKKFILSDAIKAEVDRWLTKFPADQKQSGVLYALRIIQEENGGWLTEAMMNAVADYLGMPAVSVYEVATFYNMYNLQPVGCHQINVCSSISCMLCGSETVLDYLQNKLNIKSGETTADGRFSLKAVECLAACRNAPAMQIDKTYHENLTEAKIDKILAKLE